MRLSSAVLAALVVSLAACREPEREDITIDDTSLARDLTMAATDSVVPALRDVPEVVEQPLPAQPKPAEATPKPVKRRPPPPRREPVQVAEAPKPTVVEPAVTPPAETPVPVAAPAPAPRGGAIASGTTMDLIAETKTCTNGSRPGDKIIARLAHGVVGSNGVLLPAGAEAVVQVSSVSAGDETNPARIAFRILSITANGVTYPVAGDAEPGSELERQRVDQPKNDKKKVIGGAIAGAILGQMIGKDTKATVIGAAAGAAAGTVAARAGAKYEACLPAGSTLKLTLDRPIEIATN